MIRAEVGGPLVCDFCLIVILPSCQHTVAVMNEFQVTERDMSSFIVSSNLTYFLSTQFLSITAIVLLFLNLL